MHDACKIWGSMGGSVVLQIGRGGLRWGDSKMRKLRDPRQSSHVSRAGASHTHSAALPFALDSGNKKYAYDTSRSISSWLIRVQISETPRQFHVSKREYLMKNMAF